MSSFPPTSFLTGMVLATIPLAATVIDVRAQPAAPLTLDELSVTSPSPIQPVRTGPISATTFPAGVLPVVTGTSSP